MQQIWCERSRIWGKGNGPFWCVQMYNVHIVYTYDVLANKGEKGGGVSIAGPSASIQCKYLGPKCCLVDGCGGWVGSNGGHRKLIMHWQGIASGYIDFTKIMRFTRKKLPNIMLKKILQYVLRDTQYYVFFLILIKN